MKTSEKVKSIKELTIVSTTLIWTLKEIIRSYVKRNIITNFE